MRQFLLISLGAVLGANARYWMQAWAVERWGASFPFGTLAINLIGSFLIGLFVTLASDRLLLDPLWRIFFIIGFLGSFTTFSTYTYESVLLLMQGEWLSGMFNLFGSALLGLLAVLGGVIVAKIL